jgi:hypothetical protein
LHSGRKSWKSEKKKEIVKTVKKPGKKPCYEVELNPSKDRAMHEEEIHRFEMNL